MEALRTCLETEFACSFYLGCKFCGGLGKMMSGHKSPHIPAIAGHFFCEILAYFSFLTAAKEEMTHLFSVVIILYHYDTVRNI